MVAAVLILGYSFSRNLTWQGNSQIHTLMELTATVLALMVGIMALIRHYARKDSTLLLIGAGFLGTAFLDGFHTVVTSTFFDYLSPSPPPSLIPWSWNASRIFLSMLMLLSYLAWRKEEKKGVSGKTNEIRVYVTISLSTVAFFFFFIIVPLPRAYYPGLFFGRPEEFFAASLFLMALIGYLKKGYWKTDSFEHWLILSIIVGFMGQAMFMPFSFRLFDGMFDIAHLLKKVSYICVLTGTFISMYSAYKRVEEIVDERTKELKASQEKLTDAERLAVLGKLSGGIAHEIRNPLATIDISAFNLKKRLKDADEKTMKHIDRIIKQVKNSTNIIQGLQDLAKLKEPQKERFDIYNVLENGLSISTIPQTVNIVKNVEKDKFFAYIDDKQITIIFRNILSNAVEAMDSKGTIWITVCREGDNWLEVSIKDTGHGIPPENLGKIFQSFFGTKVKGFGYGLTICKMIMDKHGGTIDAQSEVGKGTTFILRLPSADTEKYNIKIK